MPIQSATPHLVSNAHGDFKVFSEFVRFPFATTHQHDAPAITSGRNREGICDGQSPVGTPAEGLGGWAWRALKGLKKAQHGVEGYVLPCGETAARLHRFVSPELVY